MNIQSSWLAKLVKKLINAVFPTHARWFENCIILGCKYGQLRTIEEKRPVSNKGEPIPWYTYPAIEYLNQYTFSDKDVFEFGSGNSSFYWAARAKSVVSIESDSSWYGLLVKAIKKNQSLLLRETEETHVSSLVEQSCLFDVIVIDGNWRRRCARAAISCLKKGGLIILDNSDWYPNTAADLRSSGFFQIDFSGFGPINSYTWTTSIFVKPDSELQNSFSNPAPIGGIKQFGADDY